MAKSSMLAQHAASTRAASLRAILFGGALSVLVLLLSSCAVEVQNRQPARALAQSSQQPGSVYTGWRVFQDRCATCHGPAASGTPRGPDLLPRVRYMDSRRFVSHVLYRYEWGMPAARGGRDALDALVEDILARKQGELSMPVWQGEPRVTAHITDLYAYLSARAEGTQGPGRPVP